MTVASEAIELVARRESLREILAFVDGACARLGVSGSDAFDVRLAVEEVCTNVIEHGYDGADPGPLGLSLRGDAESVVITVADRGVPFDPDNAQQPDLESGWEERPLGGVGLHLVRQVMDEVRYETSADGMNSTTLVKRKSRLEGV